MDPEVGDFIIDIWDKQVPFGRIQSIDNGVIVVSWKSINGSRGDVRGDLGWFKYMLRKGMYRIVSPDELSLLELKYNWEG